ncbi:hypothetical protein EGW08_005542 [Elysia chlorotica]|uniref:T-box domain-containing protein n=1 Tax=Elysia chlorotica TaxID=188477 RepID=A0A433TYU1_ELYCH|nr:hypothetical protein EGW08_005542 [Elysia chlorotica]
MKMLSLRAQAFSVENLIRSPPSKSCFALDLTSPSVDQTERSTSSTTSKQTTALTQTVPTTLDVKTKKRRRVSMDSTEDEDDEEVKIPRQSLSDHIQQKVSTVKMEPAFSSEYEVVPETTRIKIKTDKSIYLPNNSSGSSSDTEENSPVSGTKNSVTHTVASVEGETATRDINNNCEHFSKCPEDDGTQTHNEYLNRALNVNVKAIDQGGFMLLDPHLGYHEGMTLRSQSQLCAAYRQAQKTHLPVQFCFCHGDVPCCGHPGIVSVRDCHDTGREVLAELIHADLWSSFHNLGTEMIITKSGRRMFPAYKVRLNGLDPNKLYMVKLDFLQPDSRKYRYIYHSSQWVVSGSGDSLPEAPSYVAQEGPISGKDICYQVVSFERLKLTNVEASRPGQVSLVSMQKFQPRVVVEEHVQSPTGRGERYEIVFPQTSFIAVTAYQNQQITTLKIASNPFAKGFRDSGKSRQMVYSPAPSFPLASPWNCLPMSSVPNIFSFERKRSPSKDIVDIDMHGLENLYNIKNIKKLQREDNSLIKHEDERVLRGKAYSYLSNLNNIHDGSLTAVPGMPALYPLSYKQQRSSQLTEHAQLYQRQQQQYVNYHSQVQQMLQQHRQQHADKALAASLANSSDAQFDEGSSTSVCNSAFERPSPFGALRVPPLFYPMAPHLYSHPQDTRGVKEPHFSKAPDLPPLLPFQVQSSYQHPSRLASQLDITGDDNNYMHESQLETSRRMESPHSPSRWPGGSPRGDCSHIHNKSAGTPSVVSSDSPTPSPVPLRNSPL